MFAGLGEMCIRDRLQTGEQRAVFSKQGITISIPKDALPEGIQNEDQIEVIIQKDTDVYKRQAPGRYRSGFPVLWEA